jgi:hypothetical protein
VERAGLARLQGGRIIAPLTRALGPGGHLLGVQGYGHDPGMEIVRAVWPDEDPFQQDRHQLLRATRRELGAAASDYRFHALPPSRAIFRYDMHALPTETDPGDGKIPISTLFAAGMRQPMWRRSRIRGWRRRCAKRPIWTPRARRSAGIAGYGSTTRCS